VTDALDDREDPDRYLALADGTEIEIRVKGSRFIGQAFHATGEEDARARLSVIRRRYHDATHHCFAVRIGSPEGVLERFDDDGEPSGTAGTPILSALRGGQLFDGLVVVTRYFGGTKLGTGGLARAYGKAAREALGAAPTRTVRRLVTLDVTCTYDDLGVVEALLAREGRGGSSVERTFTDRPRLSIAVPRSRAEEMERAIIDETGGRAYIGRSEKT